MKSISSLLLSCPLLILHILSLFDNPLIKQLKGEEMEKKRAPWFCLHLSLPAECSCRSASCMQSLPVSQAVLGSEVGAGGSLQRDWAMARAGVHCWKQGGGAVITQKGKRWKWSGPLKAASSHQSGSELWNNLCRLTSWLQFFQPFGFVSYVPTPSTGSPVWLFA